MSHVTYDSRSLLLDGQRLLMLSGAIHYPRSTPAMWPVLFRRSRAAGLNTVETYVFWNLHERERGVYDFSGRLDLRQFCEQAAAAGLNVVLRIGPYICAETNYGGFPAWLRDLPGVQMRTWNAPFQREMERWVRLLVEYLRPCFAPQGGPIIAAQIENEYSNIGRLYGDDGARYLQWCVDLSLSLKLDIPWVMCYGGAAGAIETINDFYGHKQLASHLQKHPDQPALWTEFYPAWYDTWGYPHNTRSAEDMAYALARFIGGGGAGINYYMWHGGTNFGRETMYLQTTSYGFEAPLDEYGHETTKSRHLAILHHILAAHAHVLLAAPPPAPETLAPQVLAFRYAAGGQSLAFVCNDDPQAPATVRYAGQELTLAPLSVALLGNDFLLLNTAQRERSLTVERAYEAEPGALGTWQSWSEPLPAKWPAELKQVSRHPEPVEQLQLTHDRTDYCWYSARITADHAAAQGGLLTLPNVGDLAYIFVDGKLRAATAGPLPEMRNLLPDDTDEVRLGAPLLVTRDWRFTQSFTLKLTPGVHELAILVAAVGLIKGDWMLGNRNMALERKGLWGIPHWQGQPIPGPWTQQPGLLGEQLGLGTVAGSAAVRWRPLGATKRPRAPLTWWRTSFPRPQGDSPLVLDLASMHKGLIWLNGHCAGRYWQVPCAGSNKVTPGAPIVPTTPIGQPTQRYYHLPAEWLRDHNTLVLLEEHGRDPRAVHLCRWR